MGIGPPPTIGGVGPFNNFPWSLNGLSPTIGSFTSTQLASTMCLGGVYNPKRCPNNGEIKNTQKKNKDVLMDTGFGWIWMDFG